MGSQVFKVLSASIITMNVMLKVKMSHTKRNCKCSQMKVSGVPTKPVMRR